MKKVVFYLFIVLTVMCALYEVTALQILPLAAGALLMGLDIFGKKSMAVAITVLSIIMVLLNGFILSVFDVIVWLLAGIVFLPRD